MEWYYAHGNERRGPVAPEVLQSLALSGEVRPSTLVWSDGMANWAPYSAVFAGGPAVAAADDRCTECGKVYPPADLLRIRHSLVCAACKPVFLQKISRGDPTGGSGAGSSGLWRRGKLLVIAAQAEFPDRCVKCNSSETVTRLKRNLQWHHPGIYFVLLANVIIYAIVAMLVRKKMTVFIGLCERHRRQRKYLIIASWSAVLASLLVFGIGIAVQSESPWLWVGASVLFLGGLLTAAIGPRVLSPTLIDFQYARVRGVCPEYLAELPEWTGS